ncbi:MAG: DUF790 family protein [Deltaproteobacteria bacterium]|nr:DUF790 family protein [Deltaproteobacteria bacterium]
MLTADLVRATVKRGELIPGYVDIGNERVQERARDILDTIRQGVGQRRGDIDAELESLLGDATDGKLFAGLAKIAFDACEFATESPVDPRELRQRVWLESARCGPFAPVAIDGLSTRLAVLQAVAGALGSEPGIVEEAMYADLPAQQRLAACSIESAEALVQRYNLGLVQALCFSASELEVCLEAPEPGRMRQLMRAVKFNQLCFSAVAEGSTYRLKIDGPASLFSQTSRYGLALAKFLGTLVLLPGPWTARAVVKWKRFSPTLTLTHESGLKSHYRDVGAYVTREAEWFRERFEALESGWALDLDPMPLAQGAGSVVVPDFGFRRDGRVAYLEILGFWRKGTIEKRLAALQKHGPRNLVVAVSRRYATEKGEVPEGVVGFAEVVPAREVLRLVEARAVTDVRRRS